MRIRTVRTKDVSVLGTRSINLNNDLVVVYGGNGAGKTLLCQGILEAFLPAVLAGKPKKSMVPGRWEVEFDLGSEMCSVAIREGIADQSLALRRTVDLGSNKNLLLSYGAGRMSARVEGGDGVRNIYPVLLDLMREQVGCVVLVDDLGAGLSLDNQKRWFDRVRRQVGSKGGQLIATVRDREFLNWVGELGLGALVVDLGEGVDPVNEALRQLRPS